MLKNQRRALFALMLLASLTIVCATYDEPTPRPAAADNKPADTATPTATTAAETAPVAATATPVPPATETPPAAATPLPTATPGPTATPALPAHVIIGFLQYQLAHFATEGFSNVQGRAIVVLSGPPVPGATVTMSLTAPDGTTETQTAVTDASGVAEMTFRIFVYGSYSLSVTDVAVPEASMVYAPERNAAASVTFTVGPEEVQVGVADNVVAFVEQFNDAFARGDRQFLFARLHPAVIDLYGAAACQSYLETVGSPDPVEVVAIESFGPWDWEIDGHVTPVMNTYSVTTQSGSIHLALTEDDLVRWFTDCGEPRANN